jgi:DNA-damage-inducible protein J
MAKTQTISARIDPDLKENAEGIFNSLGLTTSQAITLFYRQVELAAGLPFPVKLPVPNEETMRAIQDARRGYNLSGPASVDDMFDELMND